MIWNDFATLTVDTLRPVGFFSDPLFDDPARYLKELAENMGIIGAEEDFNEMPELVYYGLFAMEKTHAAEFNTKKAAAEAGPGYYTKVVTRLLSCVSTACTVRETALDRGITKVEVSAELKAPWGSGTAKTSQNFTDRSFTDGLFMEQLVLRLLGDDLFLARRRESSNGEEQVYIFPPSKDAARAMAAFEKTHFQEDLMSEEMEPTILFELPQPTGETVDDILESLGFARPKAAHPAPMAELDKKIARSKSQYFWTMFIMYASVALALGVFFYVFWL